MTFFNGTSDPGIQIAGEMKERDSGGGEPGNVFQAGASAHSGVDLLEPENPGKEKKKNKKIP